MGQMNSHKRLWTAIKQTLKKKKKKKHEQNLRDLWNNKRSNIHIMDLQEEEKKDWTEKKKK